MADFQNARIDLDANGLGLGDAVKPDSTIEQRQTGFIVLPSEEGDTTPNDGNPNGGPLDLTSVVSSLGETNAFPNAYYGQRTYNTADNSFYVWSKDGKWKKLIN